MPQKFAPGAGTVVCVAALVPAGAQASTASLPGEKPWESDVSSVTTRG
ncbi:hypothetical protein [Kitasatospora sp. NPDC096140]